MPRIVIEPIQGELPIAGFGKGAGFARCATNTKFWHGLLQPHQCPTEACTRDFDIKTLYSLKECECIAWDVVVDIADCFCDFVFWTGDGKPQISTHDELCEGISCDLGLPCPDSAPIASVAEEEGCDKQCTQYVCRYVNKYGQVGAPSKPSNVVDLTDNATLTSIAIPDNDCITHVEVFAVIAGNKTGLEQQVQNNSGFMSVGVYPIAESLEIEITELGLELDSFDYYPPPENLQGILCHDMGLAGFEGKNIWYTEANQVQAWNKKKCLDHEIKALKFWNGALYAFTESWLYRMNLTGGEGDYDFSNPFRYGDRAFPLISDARGVSSGQQGLFFPSTHGGVLVNESSARYITNKFGKDDWLSLNPKTMQTAQFDYGIGLFTDQASYLYEIGDGSYGELAGHLYQLPFKPDAVYTDNNGILNYAIGDTSYKWDSCYVIKEPCDETICIEECCEYEWHSKPLLLDTQMRFTAGFIEFVPGSGDVTFELFESDCFDEPIYANTFNEGSDQCRKSRCFRKYFRLPSCRMEDQLSIKLTGCAHVSRIVLGTSRSALRGGTSQQQ